ncbi:hypothetical protein P8452_13251 [Trifolium repens]|nr:hypothetical protein P8452_13251 [Trifolium repens]
MSLIAKQAWKFVAEPNKLVSRIFKARWRIGDGSKINVMSDPWLRGNDMLWLQSPQIRKPVAECILKIPLFEEVQEDSSS